MQMKKVYFTKDLHIYTKLYENYQHIYTNLTRRNI